MSVKEMMPIIFGVLKDIRVIGTTITMILVVSFAKFIITYKKKPSVPKVKKQATPAPAPAADTGPKPDISEKDT